MTNPATDLFAPLTGYPPSKITLTNSNDIFGGSGANEAVYGLRGNDIINGGAGNDLLFGNEGDDLLIGGGGDDHLYGGVGNDTANYALAAERVTATLAGGSAVSGDDTDTLDGIENLTGSAFDDILMGNGGANSLFGLAGNDVLEGSGGADHLDGGLGNDWAFYSGSLAGIGINLSFGIGSGGAAQGDTLASVENILGSAYGDQLGGSSGANYFLGNGGNDSLSGRGGDDSLDGGEGKDTVLGGAGNDGIFHSTGGDTVDGGDGIDTYFCYGGFVTSGVTADLQSGKAFFDDTAASTLAGLENITGSTFDDILRGDDAVNSLDGFEGNDLLRGRGGNDKLYGGAGNDDIAGGQGQDRITGGLGRDVLAGGDDVDTFVFADVAHSGLTAQTRDVIKDFNQGTDLIDLSQFNIDGFPVFDFIGESAFGLFPGQVRYETVNGKTIIYGETSADATADFSIALDGIFALTASDFIL